jgi:selenocysteine lyase/cysteine desulfurase
VTSNVISTSTDPSGTQQKNAGEPAFRAQDEAWWNHIASFYPRSPDAIINLEHGYFGAMASPVQKALDDGNRLVNERLSPFVRGEYTLTYLDELRVRLASLIGATPEEILLTRSASESMQVLIGQYHDLKSGDAVLWSNLDYPAMKNAMRWLHERRGVTVIELQIELPVTPAELMSCYEDAIRNTPNLKLMLLSQVFPSNGQVAPVKEITALARSRGVDVLVDSAHALGQMPLDVQDLDIDFAGFNLHKWIGAPLGVGFVYIRKSALSKIEPHFGDRDFPNDDIRCRLHGGTPSIGAVLAVPAALEFHDWVGGAGVKAARFSLLRNYWMRRVADLPGLRLLSATQNGTSLASFTLDGMGAQELQQVLLQRFGIFTIARSIGHRDIVRATVAMTTTKEELDQFVDALTALSHQRHEKDRLTI